RRDRGYADRQQRCRTYVLQECPRIDHEVSSLVLLSAGIFGPVRSTCSSEFLRGTSNNTRFRRFLSWLSGRSQRSCRGESPIGDRFDAWPASARSFARCHTESTRERTQAGAAAIRSS